jgi:hypothetical protein
VRVSNGTKPFVKHIKNTLETHQEHIRNTIETHWEHLHSARIQRYQAISETH